MNSKVYRIHTSEDCVKIPIQKEIKAESDPSNRIQRSAESKHFITNLFACNPIVNYIFIRMHQGVQFGVGCYPTQSNEISLVPDLPANPPQYASAPPYFQYASSDSSSASLPYPPSYGSSLNPNPNTNPRPTAPSPPTPSFPSDQYPYQYDRPLAYYENSSAPAAAPPYPPAYPPACPAGERGHAAASSYGADLYQGFQKSGAGAYDHAGYFQDGLAYDRSGYGRQQLGFEQGFYENTAVNDQGFFGKTDGTDGGYNAKGMFDVDENGFGPGVYAYDGGQAEPYGARGTSSESWVGFDDYGRPKSANVPSLKESGNANITRAVPKAETQQDERNGVQKFRVKLLPDSGVQSIMDVLCQIGLDGIRMLDPSTSRTLRIYPLETITRWEVNDSSIYTFWAKSSVDVEPRRIRLQSNSHTTSTILDTVTAATVQLKEMVIEDGPGNKNKPYSDLNKSSDQPTEKRRNPFADWVTLVKPSAEEKQHWVPDEAVTKCTACRTDFGAFVRRHHCRNCGDIFCDKCTHGRIALSADEESQPVRVCDRCLAEVTQRLSNIKEMSSKPTVQQSHKDLAKKLQEEMEKNRKATSDSDHGSETPHLWSKQSTSEATGKQMREVACPTCTVHLQVQVPSSGSETVECGVCQHPFLVSAH